MGTLVRPVRAASREVWFPFSVCGSCRAVAGGRASRRSRFDVSPSRRPAEGRFPGKVSSLRFFALRQPCAAHAAEPTVHTGPSGSCAAVSLPARRSATRPRTLHDWAGPTTCLGPATLLGFWNPPQYSPPAGPGVSASSAAPSRSPTHVFRRSSPLAVSRSLRPADFYGCRPPCLKLLPRELS